jgi:hypothetical protein
LSFQPKRRLHVAYSLRFQTKRRLHAVYGFEIQAIAPSAVRISGLGDRAASMVFIF